MQRPVWGDPSASARYAGAGRAFRLPDAPWDTACTGVPVAAGSVVASRPGTPVVDVLAVHDGPWCPVCEWDMLVADDYARQLADRQSEPYTGHDRQSGERPPTG